MDRHRPRRASARRPIAVPQDLLALLCLTLLAIQLAANLTSAPFLTHHPKPDFPRRPVPHMLPVSALQIRYPIPVLVQMKPNNLSLSQLRNPSNGAV